MNEKEAIIGMMVDFFDSEVTNDETVKEMAALILFEDFGYEWYQAVPLGSKLVDDNWDEATYRLDVMNHEAEAYEETRRGLLRSAMSC